ncbi:hypothetical protein H4R35_005065, partial [Dimargaris xerosporica]
MARTKKGRSKSRARDDSASDHPSEATNVHSRSPRSSAELSTALSQSPMPTVTESDAELPSAPLAERSVPEYPSVGPEPFYFEVGIPINCLATVATDPELFVVGGGGGPSRSGVANRIMLNRIDAQTKKVTTIASFNMEAMEDAPTSVSVHPHDQIIACGANKTSDAIEAGHNKSTRILDYSSDSIRLTKEQSVMASTNIVDYQQVTLFDPKGKHLLTAGSEGTVNLLAFPSLKPVFSPMVMENGEVLAADFSQTGGRVAVLTAQDVSIFGTRSGKGVQRIDCPVYKGKVKCQFRCCVYGRDVTKDCFYTVVNAKDRSRALVAKWNTKTWKTEAFRAVCKEPIMAAAMHPKGTCFAVATAKNGIYVLDALNLKTRVTIPDAHTFAITSLGFTSDGFHLVSGSVDNTCCIIPIPEQFPE